MPTQITINHQTLILPSNIEDVTIGDLIRLRRVNIESPLDVFQWGIGKTIELPDTKQTDIAVGNTLSLITPVIDEVFKWMRSDDRLTVPATVHLFGLDVTIKPGLLNELPYWGSVKCKEIIKEEQARNPFDPTDRIPEIIAHYLYSYVTKSPYDEAKADEFAKDIVMSMQMKQAVQLGNFFLLRQKRYFLSKRNSLLTSLMLIRKRLVLRYSRSMEM